LISALFVSTLITTCEVTTAGKKASGLQLYPNTFLSLNKITISAQLMTENNPARYNIKVNDFEFSFTEEQLASIDLVQKSPNVFNLLIDHQSINGTLVESDESCKKQTVEIEGEVFDIQIKDNLDLTLDKMGFNIGVGKQIKEIKAPMPGMVLEIAVAEGQQVHEGDKILILVAMKMENSIAISTSAIIKRIAVNAGEAVEKGQVLVELD
jgi:biotin carboxyl carrier protein